MLLCKLSAEGMSSWRNGHAWKTPTTQLQVKGIEKSPVYTSKAAVLQLLEIWSYLSTYPHEKRDSMTHKIAVSTNQGSRRRRRVKGSQKVNKVPQRKSRESRWFKEEDWNVVKIRDSSMSLLNANALYEVEIQFENISVNRRICNHLTYIHWAEKSNALCDYVQRSFIDDSWRNWTKKLGFWVLSQL